MILRSQLHSRWNISLQKGRILILVLLHMVDIVTVSCLILIYIIIIAGFRWGGILRNGITPFWCTYTLMQRSHEKVFAENSFSSYFQLSSCSLHHHRRNEPPQILSAYDVQAVRSSTLPGFSFRDGVSAGSSYTTRTASSRKKSNPDWWDWLREPWVATPLCKVPYPKY